MHLKEAPIRYAILFLPWVLSLLVESQPLISYIFAWLGSFFIFFLSYSGFLKPLPQDRPAAAQIMRPVFIVQVIFAGYMCCTSIFYVLNLYGYSNFHPGYVILDAQQMDLTAQCQRYYCLAHASFTTGIMLFMNYPVKQVVKVEQSAIVDLLFWTAVLTFPVSVIFLMVPGLSQVSNQFTSLSFIACTVALAYAIPHKKIKKTLICCFLYGSNFYTALISGFKEPIILSVLMLGVFLYPSYKKAVLATFIPALIFLFLVLPTYASVFRASAWTGGQNSEDARNEALDAALNKSSVADETTWAFLVNRLSEIQMFTQFVQSTPKQIDFYGFNLVNQSFIAVIPRVFWPGKPSTEELVMQRVYDAGVVNPHSSVSAKPAFIVDAYLSGGAWGIFLCLFVYGAAVQLISLKAEALFGGYDLGVALVFSGLFQIFWRGLSFEFILNNVIWSYVTMLALAKILRVAGILAPIKGTATD